MTTLTTTNQQQDTTDDHSQSAHRKQIRGSSLLLAGRLFSLGINCLAQVLIVRYLTTAEYGAWAYALSVVVFCEAFSTLSLEDSLARFVPIYYEYKQFSRLLGAVAFSLGIIAAASLLFMLPFYFFSAPLSHLIKEPRSLQLLAILILLVPLESTDALFEGLLASLTSARAIFTRKYVLGPGLKIMAVLMVRFASASVRLLAIAYLAAAAIGLTFYLGTLLKTLRKHGILQPGVLRNIEIPARELIGFTFSVMTTTVVSVLNYSVSAMLLGYFHNPEQVAYYRVIYPLATLNQVVFQAFMLLYTPAAARFFARNDSRSIHRLYWSNAVWMATLSFPIFVATFAFAGPIVKLLYGARYAPSAIVLMFIATGYYVSVTMGFSAQTLQVVGRVRYITWVNIGAIVANVIANLIVIPRYGATGAAVVTLGTMLLHNVLKQAALRASGVGAPGRKYLAFYSVLGLSVIAVFAAYLLMPVHYIFAFLIGATAAAAVFVTGIMHLDVASTFPEALKLPLIGTLCARRFSGGFFILSALDAVLTAPTREARRLSSDLYSLLHPHAENYGRVAAFARLVARVWPGSSAAARKVLVNTQQLPFAADEIAVTGYGYSATVFKLRAKGTDWALKIYRDSFGFGLGTAQELASGFKRQHATVANWYNRGLNLVPPMAFCVVRAPLLATVAAAGIQPFISEKKRDLFHDFKDEELIAIAKSSPSFHSELIWFADRTVEIMRTEDRCLDILGRQNVLVVGDGAHCRLAVADTGVFQLMELREQFPARIASLNRYVARLEGLATALRTANVVELPAMPRITNIAEPIQPLSAA